MADVVNLNRFRKAKAKVEADERAQRNRILHGRTKAEREAARTLSQQQRDQIDAHRLEPSDGD